MEEHGLFTHPEQATGTCTNEDEQNPEWLDNEENSSKDYTEARSGLACNKCLELIDEQYFVVMDNREWHMNCLLCDICQKNLAHLTSCYERDNLTFCKDCYTRSCSKTCHLCSTAISATDFVYKLNGVYIHWDCFNCTACKVPLESGQKFGLIESMLYCEEHFLATKESLEQSNLSSDVDYTGKFYFDYESILQYNTSPIEMHLQELNLNPDYFACVMSPIDIMPSTSSMSMTDHLDNILPSTPMTDAMLHEKNRCKRKRARTSFRQEQLKALRSAFDRNQSPDTAELMRMSQQICLSKKVLQVWFQNARAKKRRDRAKCTHDKTGIRELQRQGSNHF